MAQDQHGDGAGGWRLLAADLRPRRRGLAVAVAVGLAWTAAKVTVPLLVQRAVDRGIEASSGALWQWSLLVLTAGFFTAALTGLRRWFAFREARGLEAELRERLYAHIQRLHIAFHDGAQTGQLMSRAHTDLQQVQSFVVLVPLAVSNFATVAAVAAVLAVIDLPLALAALAPLPLLSVIAVRFSRRMRPRTMAIQAESAQLATVVEETVSGIRVLKGFGAEPVVDRRLEVEADDVYDASLAAAAVRARHLPILDVLPSVGLVVVLGLGGHRVLQGHITVGTLVAFNAYVAMVVWPLRMVGMLVSQGQRAASAITRVHEVLATEPQVVDRLHARAVAPREPGGSGTVRFEGVRFGYVPARPVLDGFDLELPAGTSTALVGGTGSGKSTVARLIPRFYDVDAGRITLDGVDLRDLRLHDLRAAVGLVFEETFLFNESVRANIAFADPDAPFAAVERAARLAGAAEFIEQLPEGYDTVLGERGFSLSGGQRQRIAIARAVLADPRVLILDDATSAVDASKEHEIRRAMATVMAGRTTVVIAHRPATIALADRVVLVEDGRVAATGTHAELLEGCAAYRRVLAASAPELDPAALGAGAG